MDRQREFLLLLFLLCLSPPSFLLDLDYQQIPLERPEMGNAGGWVFVRDPHYTPLQRLFTGHRRSPANIIYSAYVSDHVPAA